MCYKQDSNPNGISRQECGKCARLLTAVIQISKLFKIRRNQPQLKCSIVSESLGQTDCILEYYIAITVFTKNFHVIQESS